MAVKVQQDWAQALAEETNNDNVPMPVPALDRNREPYLNSAGTPATIQVLGERSDAVKLFDRQQTTRALRNGAGKKLTVEEIEAMSAERCAVASTGWDICIKGQEVPFSRENATTLYRTAEWIRDDVFIGMRERAEHFAKK